MGFSPKSKNLLYINRALELYDGKRGLMEIYNIISKEYGVSLKAIEGGIRLSLRTHSFNGTVTEFINKMKPVFDGEIPETVPIFQIMESTDSNGESIRNLFK